MPRLMYDAVTPSRIPAGAALVAGYVNGKFANLDGLRSHCPHAVIVGISVTASADLGDVLDVETGDATPAQAPGWVKKRRAAGADPTVYCNESTWPSVLAAFKAAGVAQPHYWIAKWDGSANIPAGAVAKQFQTGAGFDVSSVAAHWPGIDPAPKPAPPKTPPAKGKTYTVVHGDTLSGIAAAHRITLAALELANPQIKDPDVITVGQVLQLPTGAAPTPRTYAVVYGDTLSGIAAAHGVTLAALELANPQVKDPNKIFPGQVLHIP